MHHNNFKDKIKDISNSNILNVSYFTCAAYVLSTNESANVCSIAFIDSNGEKRTVDNIPVILSSIGTIGWFPNKGDYVNIEVKNGVCQILSPCTNYYNSKYRHRNDIKTNILTDMYNYNIGGTIF